jgi:hypothetical protein
MQAIFGQCNLQKMKARVFYLIFFFQTSAVFSQTDLLVLKQRNQTIQTWIPGSFIDFQFSSHQWIKGIIKSVKNDSILIEQVLVERIPNQFGFLSIDTAKLGLMKLHVREIYGMPKRNYSSGIISNGVLFQMGGGAYIFLNIFNSLIHNDAVFGKENVVGLSMAAGFFLLGKMLAATHKTYVVLGKKYTMSTIHLGNNQPNEVSGESIKRGIQ